MHSFVATASLLATTLISIGSAIPLRSVVKRDLSAQVVVYYGQGAGQPRLNVYCDDPNIDIIPVGFVSGWPKKPGNGGWPSADFGNQCGGTEMAGTKMFKTCNQLVEDVAYCHTKGKKILISIGGHADSTQVLASDADGEEFADYMWHMFGPTPAGWDGPRPFGASVVDGFDFDVEANGNVGYGAMAKRLRANMQSDDPSGKYLLTAAPQCPTPDAQIGDAISQADFDYLFIQFYNTKWCSARAALDHTYGSADQNGGKPTDISFLNWAQWVNDNAVGNPSLFIGLPGSTSALGDSTMYLSPSDAQTLLKKFYHHPSFGGVMVWDATYAKNNNDFVGSIKKALNQCDCDSDVCHTSTTTTTTTTTRTSTTTPVTTTKTSSSTASTTLSTTWSVSSTTTTHASTVATTTSTTSSVSSTTTSSSAAPTTTSTTTSVSSTTTTRYSTTATTTSTTSSLSWSTTTSPAVSSTTKSQDTSSATTTSTSSSSTSTTRESSTTTTYSHSTRPYGSSTTASESSSATTTEGTTSSTTYGHPTPPVGGSTTTSETTSEPMTTAESTTSTTMYSHSTPPVDVSTTFEYSSSTTTSSHSVPPFGDSTTSVSSSSFTTSTFSHSVPISTPSGTTTSPSVDATSSSVSYQWGSWLSTSTSLRSADPASSSSSVEHTWAPWSTTSSKPVDPTTSSSSSKGHTWAPWSTTSKSADPTSSTIWGPSPTIPSDVYVTTTTTVYTDICPTGFTRVTATITATITVTDTVNQPTGKDAPWPTGPAGVPTGFYATTTVCSTGCAGTPVTVTVTVPVPTGAITKTIVPTAATPAVSTPVQAASGKPTGVASGTESSSGSATGSPIATDGRVNGVKAFTGGAAVDQAPATAFSVAVCVVLAVAGLIL